MPGNMSACVEELVLVALMLFVNLDGLDMLLPPGKRVSTCAALARLVIHPTGTNTQVLVSAHPFPCVDSEVANLLTCISCNVCRLCA